MEIQSKIKKRINIAIKQAGKTKLEVCRNSGISYALLSQYQCPGNRRIPAEWIYIIAKETGVSTDFIFGNE